MPCIIIIVTMSNFIHSLNSMPAATNW